MTRAAVSSANESDLAHVHELLHGEKAVILADVGYTGADKREEAQHLDGVTWCIAAKPGQFKSIPEWSPWREAMKDLESAFP